MKEIKQHSEQARASYTAMTDESAKDGEAAVSIAISLKRKYESLAASQGKFIHDPEIALALKTEIDRDVAPYIDTYLVRFKTFPETQDKIGNISWALCNLLRDPENCDVGRVIKCLNSESKSITVCQSAIEAFRKEMKDHPERIKPGEESMVARIQENAASLAESLNRLADLSSQLAPYARISQTSSQNHLPDR